MSKASASVAKSRTRLVSTIAAVALLALVPLVAAAAAPEAPSADPSTVDGGLDTSNLETPVFPKYTLGDAFRVRLQSRFLPAAHFDGFDTDLTQPSLRLQATAPISDRGSIQVSGRFTSSLYDVDGTSDFLGGGRSIAFPLDELFSASLSLQGAYGLNKNGGLFLEDEQWSILANVFGRSRWESGSFSEGLTGGGSVAVGYEIDDLVRVAVGWSVKSQFDRGGVSFDPVLSLRWNVTDRFTLRNRGTGLQLEYRLLRDLEIFAAGFIETDKARLGRVAGLPDDLSFRDEAVQVGAGAEWKISKNLRMNLEAGAVVKRTLSIKSRELGTLWKERGDPSAYLEIRIEVRP